LPPSHGTFIRCWNAERFRSRKAGMGSRQDSVMVTPVCDCVCPAPGLRGPEQTAAVDGYWTIVPVKWLKVLACVVCCLCSSCDMSLTSLLCSGCFVNGVIRFIQLVVLYDHIVDVMNNTSFICNYFYYCVTPQY